MNLGLHDQFREARKLFVTSRQLESDGLTSSLSSTSFELYNLGQLIEPLWVLVLHLSNVYQSTLQTIESCSRVRDNYHHYYYRFNPTMNKNSKVQNETTGLSMRLGAKFWGVFSLPSDSFPEQMLSVHFYCCAAHSMSRPVCRDSKWHLAWSPRWTHGVGGTADCGASWGYASSLDRE